MITITVARATLNINKGNQPLIIAKINQLDKKMSEQQDQIDLVTAQVDKVFGEVTALKAKLEAAIIELEAQVAAGTSVDLTALKAAVQTIDDINPDVVA